MPTQPSTKIKQVRSLVDSGMSSSDARSSLRSSPRLNPTIPPVIPSTALAGNKTFEDVMDTRADLEQTSIAANQFNTDFSSLTGRIGNTKLESPFTNPEQYLNRLLLKGPTDTQMALDSQRQTQASGIRDFAQDYTQTGTDARKDLGIPDLQSNLAETRTRIAERQVQLRETLRNYEENAQKTGMVREAFQGQKAKLQSDAATELADLAIIESAQLGNLQEARAEVDSILAEKRQSFEFENQAIQAEIERLNAMDTRESEARSEQLQIALQERNRNIETSLANEKEQREYLVQAAAEGADQGTLLAIRNATSPEQAAFLAGPWIGKMDRLNTQSQINSRNLNDTITLAEKGDAKAIEQLGFDPRATTGNFEAESNLRKEFNALPTVKEAVTVQQSYTAINSALQEAMNATQRGGSPAAADQALIISFNKMLDPTSVVREGEFARSTQGQAYLDQIQAKIDSAIRGGAGLTDQMRQEIVSTTNVLYADYVRTHNDQAYTYRQNAKRQGGDPAYVAGYLDTTTPPDQAQDGDILVINGIPMEKKGDEFIPIESI